MTSENGADRVEQQVPYVLAMVLCDAIYIDPSTGKKSLLGLFSAIFSQQYPVRIPGLCLYVAMTDGHGKTPITITLVDVNEERPPIFESKSEFDFTDPRMVVENLSMMGNIEIPEPGEYRVQLYACGTPLMERRMVVLNPSEPPNA